MDRRILFVAMCFLLSNCHIYAQTENLNKAQKKELRKEVKARKRAGWKAVEQARPLAAQIAECIVRRDALNDKGGHKFHVCSGTAVADDHEDALRIANQYALLAANECRMTILEEIIDEAKKEYPEPHIRALLYDFHKTPSPIRLPEFRTHTLAVFQRETSEGKVEAEVCVCIILNCLYDDLRHAVSEALEKYK